MDDMGGWTRSVSELLVQGVDQDVPLRVRGVNWPLDRDDLEGRASGAAGTVLQPLQPPELGVDASPHPRPRPGGLTTPSISGPLCRHDHQLEIVGRWRLSQPEPGHFTWLRPPG